MTFDIMCEDIKEYSGTAEADISLRWYYVNSDPDFVHIVSGELAGIAEK